MAWDTAFSNALKEALRRNDPREGDPQLPAAHNISLRRKGKENIVRFTGTTPFAIYGTTLFHETALCKRGEVNAHEKDLSPSSDNGIMLP